jgi:chromosome segregation ATPase
MDIIETHIKSVNEKLQQLLKNHNALKKENDNLKATLKKVIEKEEDSKSKIQELEQKVSILKTASGQMSEGEQKEFEKRVNQYIKEIDKCIGLLSE